MRNGFKKNLLKDKKIADSECSHEIRRQLLLGRKMMTNIVC